LFCFADDVVRMSNVTSEGNGNIARTKNDVSVLPSSIEDSGENIIMSSVKLIFLEIYLTYLS
jgi:hypothetical protein